jgi:beta-ribofuranosylaminobenzene 5'-phosphate synthase
MTTSSLPSAALRMLVGTDGSVTALLEASFEAPVEVRTVVNEVDHRLPTPSELELEPGRPVLWRHAVLHVDGRPVLRASSVVALDRLDAAACSALLAGKEPMGSVLRGLELRRELLATVATEATPGDVAELAIDEDATVLERVSRIVGAGRPLVVLNERIPTTIFDS